MNEGATGATKAVAEAVKAACEPVTKLIEAVSKGVGKLYEPVGIVKKAKAEAEAGLILAQADADRRELAMRAGHRLAYIETRRQEVIESITKQAIGYLPENVSSDPVSEDWMVQFFENAKDVSEPDLQKLWAAVLAREVTKPGSYSRRTLAMLKTFDRTDAELFTFICSVSFGGERGSRWMFQAGATSDALVSLCGGPLDVGNHLISIGLLSAEVLLYNVSDCAHLDIKYFGKSYKVSAPAPPTKNAALLQDLEYTISIRSMTVAGNEIATVVQPTQIPGFVEKLSEEFSLIGVRFHEISGKG